MGGAVTITRFSLYFIMTHVVLTLVTPPSTPLFSLGAELVKALSACVGEHMSYWLAEGTALDMRGIAPTAGLREKIADILAPYPIDWCVQQEARRSKQLLISDMDSTIIGQECIDEIAALCGVGEQVAAITERAMQGELDFAASLTERVALLQGLPITMLEQVWEEKITLNAGARTLVQTMRAHGAQSLLVSGGFTFFSARVAEAAGFAEHHANTLEVAGDVLTGRVIPPILDKDAKRSVLLEACASHGIEPSATLAVGDGANDAAMIQAAGLGVAYFAKPLLQSLAGASVTHTDLTTLLYFQGYREGEFVV
jgi:phosphoserine phosphatase